MAVGDQAKEAGFDLVPDTGDQGLVKLGAQQMNQTRDYVAQVLALIPTGKVGYRGAAGISSGTSDPVGGNDGDIYFKIIS